MNSPYATITLDPEKPTRRVLVVGALDGIRGYQRIAGGEPGTPIPPRALKLDPAGIAEAQADHEWIMEKFAEAKSSQRKTTDMRLVRRERGPRKQVKSNWPLCKRCKVEYEPSRLKNGLCPACYDEVTSF